LNADRPSVLRRALPLLAIVALSLGLWLGLHQFQTGMQGPADLRAATALHPPRPLQDFALTGHDGQPFTLDSLRERWTFLSIGYTHCPDVCPTTLATFDAVAKRADSATKRPQFLFVSVDPERDTPEKLGQYVTYFNPAFRAATGPQDALKRLTGQLGLIYRRVDGQDTALGYMVDHSASILLIDPMGRLAAIFSAPHDPDAMAQDYLTITNQTNQRH
jgi:protein SCO1/2